MILAMMVSMGSFVSTMINLNYGYGQHVKNISAERLITCVYILMITRVLAIFEVTLAKASVVLMFLKLIRMAPWRRRWQVGTYGLLVYLVVHASILLTLNLTMCRHTHGEDACTHFSATTAVVAATSTVFSLTDFQLSLAPMMFMCTLKRSLKERMAVIGLMSIGLIASLCGCLKFIGYSKLISGSDPTYDLVEFNLFSIGETSIGLIAANLPPLKAKGEELYHKLQSQLSSRGRSISSESSTDEQRNKKFGSTSDYTPGASVLDELDDIKEEATDGVEEV